jgi:DNA-binding NarL/FixJ family response regulator
VIESLEPDEIDQVLKERHVPNISEARQRIFAARICGCPAEEIAERMNLSVSSVYREIETIQIAIFDPLGLKHDAWATSRWFHHHTTCCVAFAAGLIENRRIFPREKGVTG